MSIAHPPRLAFRHMLRRQAGAVFLLFPFLAPTPAAAQDIAAAEALFDKGFADMQAGRYETGCKAIAESHRLDPRPGTLFTLATCEDEWGHIATAVTRYGDYLALFERLPEDRKVMQGDRPNVARARREKLAPGVPQLTLVLSTTAPAGTVVKRDGEVVAEAALGLGLPVDPGEHVVSTQAPGGPVQETRVTITRGEKKTVTLELKPASTTAPSGTQPPQILPSTAPSRSYAGPIVSFGAATVGFGLGIGFGAAVLGRRSELDGACPDKTCPESERGNLDGAKALSHVSTAGFVLAGVGAALGTVLLLLPAPASGKSGKITVRLGLSQVGVGGTF